MEFDKKRIYTAVNADELKVGSKCYFADYISSLKECLEHNAPSETLVKIHDESFIGRFDSNTTENCILAYLIEPPKEPLKDRIDDFFKYDIKRIIKRIKGENL